MRIRAGAFAFAAFTALLLVGCGMGMRTSMSMGTTAAFLFVTNSGSASVSAFAVSSAGGLTPMAGAPAGAGAEFMAFDSAHKVLYVSNGNANTVSAFAVNTSTGALTAVSGSPFAAGARPLGVAVDAVGRFLFVANQAESSISVFAIGANGALSPVPGSPFVASNAFGLAVNPSGTELFAANFPDSQTSDLNSVSAFQVGANGELSAIAGSPFATANAPGFASSLAVAADTTGKFLFVGDHMAQTVVPFTISATGGLNAVTALPSPAPSCSVSCHNNPLRLAVHPSDRFVYATNVQAGTVTTFSVANGALAAVSDTATGQHPFGVALDPTGSFLFVANKMDNTISAFAVNSSSGMLTPISGSPFSGGLNAPTDIVVAKQ
jgi:6-phosphogluconolactonase (cycloisomerase 2 family)